MKKLLPVVIFVTITACSSSNEANYKLLIEDLSTALVNGKGLPEKYFLTKIDLENLNEDADRQQSDSGMEDFIAALSKQQTEQFWRVQDQLEPNFFSFGYKFDEADSIGGIVKGVHYFDFGLKYRVDSTSKPKFQSGSQDSIKVCVFEMVVIDGEYKMIDDIYLTNARRWEEHLEMKKDEIKRSK